MSDMVERVARAILSGHDWTTDLGVDDAVTGWEGIGADWQQAYLSMARAAIEAMREPTPEVIQAWLAFYEVRNEPKHMTKRATTIWQTLISAALSQSQSPNPPGPHFSVGSDGSPSTLSSEAGGAKMEGACTSSPDRAAKADVHTYSERAVSNSKGAR